MKRPNIITERLTLASCAKNETVRIPHSETATRKSIGTVVLAGIKPLAKDRVQIKYRSVHGGTVQKADVDGSLIVERIRDAVEADGPGAGKPVVDTAEHEGVVYAAVDPAADPEELIAAALGAHAGGPLMTPGQVMTFFKSTDMGSQVARMVRNMMPRIDGSRLALPGGYAEAAPAFVDMRLH